MIKIIFVSLLFVFSLILNNVLLRFSKTLGIRNHDINIIRWSSHSKPALGGISFFVVFLISIAISGFIVNNNIYNARLIGIITACCLGFIMGLADDAYNTNPSLKFIIQLSCALVLIFTGTYIHFFDNIWLNYILTIVWVIGIMNSINMLDNMDAITTTIAIVILSGIAVLAINNQTTDSVLFYVVLANIAALLGFLFFNWYPSKMFMGDTGSQYLGALLASLGIIYYWNSNDGTVSVDSVWVKCLLPLLAFMIPIVDTTTVVINRLKKGSSPFVGGKDHTTHHLFYVGLSERKIAVLFFTISFAAISLIIYFFNYHTTILSAFLIIGYLFFVVVFASLYYPTIVVKRANENRAKENNTESTQ